MRTFKPYSNEESEFFDPVVGEIDQILYKHHKKVQRRIKANQSSAAIKRQQEQRAREREKNPPILYDSPKRPTSNPWF